MQNDIKRLNGTLAPQVAKASKQKNRTANEADITGRNRKPDGIKEVFTTYGKGNMKSINEFGLTKGTYHSRRKGHSLSQFKPDTNNILAGLGEDGSPAYEHSLAQE